MKRSRILGLLMVAACSGEVAQKTPIADNSPLPEIGGGRIDSTALACQSLDPPSADYGTIGAIAVGPNQQVAWADLGSGQFRVKDASGAIHLSGTTGNGNGQFQLMGALGWLNSDFWVSDLVLHRVQYFDESGKFKRVVNLGPASLVWIPTPEGRYVGLAAKQPKDTTWAVVSMKEGKTKVDTIVTFPAPLPAQFTLAGADGAVQSLPNPFSTQTWVGRSDDGTRWCAAIPQKGNDVLLKCVRDSGAPIFDSVLTLSPRIVPPVAFDSALANFITNYHADLGALLAVIPQTSTLPLVTGMRVDTRGDVWIDRSHPLEPVSTWVRVRRDGAVRDTVVIPSRMSPKSVRNDTMWSADLSKGAQQPLVVRCTLGK